MEENQEMNLKIFTTTWLYVMVDLTAHIIKRNLHSPIQ